MYGIKEEQLRKAKLIPWNEEDLDDILSINEDPRVQHEPNINYFMVIFFNSILKKINNIKSYSNDEKSGAKDELLPAQTTNELDVIDLSKFNLNTNNNLINVFTDLSAVKEHLTDAKFCLVDEISKADIIFVRQHHKDYKYILRFPQS